MNDEPTKDKEVPTVTAHGTARVLRPPKTGG